MLKVFVRGFRLSSFVRIVCHVSLAEMQFDHKNAFGLMTIEDNAFPLDTSFRMTPHENHMLYEEKNIEQERASKVLSTP